MWSDYEDAKTYFHKFQPKICSLMIIKVVLPTNYYLQYTTYDSNLAPTSTSIGITFTLLFKGISKKQELVRLSRPNFTRVVKSKKLHLLLVKSSMLKCLL